MDNSLATVLNFEEQVKLDIFKSLVKDQKDFETILNKVSTSESSLLRYLRYRKNNPEDAAKWIPKLLKTVEKIRQYRNFIVPSRENFKEYPRAVVLKGRDKNGCQVIIFKLKDWDTSKTNLMEFCLLNVATIDMITDRQWTQLNGVVAIIDFEDWGPQHVLHANPVALKQMVDHCNTSPILVKGVHFVNNPAALTAIWNFFKTFLKEKIKSRVHIHGHNYKTSLHKYLEPSLLPNCYGGLLGDDNFGEEGFEDLLLERKDYYERLFDVPN